MLVAWSRWCSELPRLKGVKLPRYPFASRVSTRADVQIHVFSDASPQAYEAVAYVRAEESTGFVFSQLFLAKARVAPIKQAFLPYLELLGALARARLASYITAKVFLPVATAFY